MFTSQHLFTFVSFIYRPISSSQGAVSWDKQRIIYWEQEAEPEPRLSATWLTVHPSSVIVDFSFYTNVRHMILLRYF